MQQAINILDEMIKSNIETRNLDLYGAIKMNVTARYIYERIEEEVTRAKERIQALGDGWIPVTERLPEKELEYLVFDPEDSLISDYFINGEWQYTKPTHWQPILLPPKQ